jgi:hypothetical protein
MTGSQEVAHEGQIYDIFKIFMVAEIHVIVVWYVGTSFFSNIMPPSSGYIEEIWFSSAHGPKRSLLLHSFLLYLSSSFFRTYCPNWLIWDPSSSSLSQGKMGYSCPLPPISSSASV